MNNWKVRTGLILLGTIFVISNQSCVSKKKFDEATASFTRSQKQNRELNENIESLKSRLELMEEANSSASAEIEAKNANLKQKESLIEENSKLFTEQQEKLKNLQATLDRQREKSDALKAKMADALKGFSSDQLTVAQKNGKVYVSLQEKLLFPSGSAVVNAEGKDALSKLAQVLNLNPDINIAVEGHTDSIPIKIRFEDNWALSTARAAAIVRILTQDYGVDPTRVTASGRSKYLPIESNETPEGRAKNRRTEIILEPNLNAILDILDKE